MNFYFMSFIIIWSEENGVFVFKSSVIYLMECFWMRDISYWVVSYEVSDFYDVEI